MSPTQPLIYLGDRGFLKRYGSRSSPEEIECCARRVVSASDLGLASGDWPSAQAIGRALEKGPNDKHVYHSRFLIQVIDSTTRRMLSVAQVQRAPALFYNGSRYHFKADHQQISEDLEIVRQFRPGLVTVGGDWLDILIAQGNFTLIDEILQRLNTSMAPSITRVLLSFRPSKPFLKFLLMPWVSGAALPVNLLNMQHESYLRSVQVSVPLYAVHCLAGGLIPLAPALDYVINHMHAHACIVGACNPTHLEALIAFSTGTKRILI